MPNDLLTIAKEKGLPMTGIPDEYLKQEGAVEVPKTTSPVTIEDSQAAEKQVQQETVRLQGLQDQVSQAIETAKKLKETIKTEGITPDVKEGKPDLDKDEQEYLGVEEPVEDPEITALKGDIANLDTEYQGFVSNIDSLLAAASVATAAQITSIKATYTARKAQMEDIGRRQLASMQNLNIRLGTSRYSPTTALGLTTAVERQTVMKLAELDAQELQAISEANRALEEKKYQLLHDKIGLVDTIRDRKATALKDLQDIANERNEEIMQEQETIQTQAAVIDAVRQGNFNPVSIFEAMGGTVGLEEINSTMDLILESEIGFNEEVIDRYNDVEGNRMLVIQDKNTGEIKTLKVGAVEAEDKTLSVSEAKALGVPFGTTEGQALGIIPKGSKSEAFIEFRKTIRGEKAIDTFNDLKLAYNSVFTGFQQNTAQGDLAMISGFARLLDPGSVVRPAEFETVREAQGLLDRAENFLDKLKEGKQMPEDVRERLFNMANALITKNAQPIVTNITTTYKPVAEDLGLSFEQAAPEIKELQGIIDTAQSALKGGGTMTLEQLAEAKGFDLEAARKEASDEEIRAFLE